MGKQSASRHALHAPRRALRRRGEGGGFASAAEIGASAPWIDEDLEPVRRLALDRAWRRAVGPALESVTRIAAWRSGTLSVEILDRAWEDDLVRLAGRIRDTVNSQLGSDPAAGPGRIQKLLFHVPPGSEARRAHRASVSGAPRPGARAGPATDPPRSPAQNPGAPADGEALRRRLSEVARRYLRGRG